jgi:hypothetical protein
MKMDAMQKRRIRKVARLHFALTFFVLLLIAFTTTTLAVSKSIVHLDSSLQAWTQFLLLVLVLLQPVAALFFAKITPLVMEHFGNVHPEWLSMSIISIFFVFAFFSVPSWSICFGWLFVKFTNWLNHFPVLGRKVFEIVNHQS